MGNYNPHAPYILGEEWPPVRQANYEPDIEHERGYEFVIDHTTAVVSGAYFVSSEHFASKPAAQLISVYPAGTQDLTGPIKQIDIPIRSIGASGSGSFTSGGAIFFDPETAAEYGISFAVTDYIQQLAGKRIVDIDLLFVVGGTSEALSRLQISLERILVPASGPAYVLGAVDSPLNSPFVASIGELNPFWSSNITSIYTLATSVRMYPWRYEELSLLDTSAAPSVRLIFRAQCALLGFPDDFLSASSFVLRVTYCEEKRVLYGADWVSSNHTDNTYAYDTGKYVQLRTTALALPTTIPAGPYLVTQTWTNFPPIPLRVGIFPPKLYALRELYQVEPQRGIQVNRTNVIDAEFTSEQVDVLPQLTLHTATAVVTGSHPYGLQSDAPVYGAITASQDIHEDDTAASMEYPQVRFYARRFGNTTAPLTLTAVDQGNMAVSISVAEFDALPEIVDGWKEVNLRFTTAPTFPTGSVNPNFDWSAAGETASNQWQVLAATSVSFAAGQSPAAATYQAPDGAADLLEWKSPAITGIANDTLSDAVILLSTDPPMVTGFALSTCSMDVSGIGVECGVPHGCIATAITGNQISWNNGVICDTFSREVSGGWGVTDTGETYAIFEGAPSGFTVDGTGNQTHTAVDSFMHMELPESMVDFDIYTDYSFPVLPAGDTPQLLITARLSGAGANFVQARVFFAPTGVVTVDIQQVLATVSTTSSTRTTSVGPMTPGRVRFRGVGNKLFLKLWAADEPEPTWLLTFTTTVLTTGTFMWGSAVTAGIVNTLPITFTFDNIQVASPALADSHYEIQRYDAVDGFWSTILDTGNLCITGMCDFEARVGVESQYRMRVVNIMDFAGPWVTGAATLPSPGVTISGDGNSMLIFTSNISPSSSLAYVMQFENRAVESFAFGEADQVTFQRMYGRNFPVAFHPLEREGEKFTRALLVNAAAIALPSLGNFRGLRDLAWQDLPYVCVRDELGNRWYANVRVPTGEVRMDRTVYIAQVEVTEVSETPCPVE